jgi:hypothetical protein
MTFAAHFFMAEPITQRCEFLVPPRYCREPLFHPTHGEMQLLGHKRSKELIDELLYDFMPGSNTSKDVIFDKEKAE